MVSKRVVDHVLDWYGCLRSVMPGFVTQPLGYYCYVTKKCNLSCEYCWQRASAAGGSASPELRVDEWLAVFATLPRHAFVGFSGGEPLLYAGMCEMLQALKGKHPVTINTNGALLDERMAREIITSGVRNVSVSLDGFEDVHDVWRSQKGLFARVTGAIRQLQQMKRSLRSRTPAVTIKMVLTDAMVDRLAAFHAFCENDLRADCLNISLMKTKDHAQYDLDCVPSMADVVKKGVPRCHPYAHTEAIVNALETVMRGARGKRCEVLLYPRMTKRTQWQRLFAHGGAGVFSSCYIPWSLLTILPGGDIIPCLSVKLGNVKDLGYDLRKVNALPQYRTMTQWRTQANKGAVTQDMCNMCCFARVNDRKDLTDDR